MFKILFCETEWFYYFNDHHVHMMFICKYETILDIFIYGFGALDEVFVFCTFPLWGHELIVHAVSQCLIKTGELIDVTLPVLLYAVIYATQPRYCHALRHNPCKQPATISLCNHTPVQLIRAASCSSCLCYSVLLMTHKLNMEAF